MIERIYSNPELIRLAAAFEVPYHRIVDENEMQLNQ
jgi:hypothetical protein